MPSRSPSLARRPPAPAGRWERVGQWLVGALAGTAVVALAASAQARSQAAVVTFLTLACAALAISAEGGRRRLPPSMAIVPLSAGALLALAVLAVARAATGTPDVGVGALALAFAVQLPASALSGALAGRCRRRRRPLRVAVIGDAPPADMLRRELRLAGKSTHALVGRIAGGGASAPCSIDERVPCLGRIADVAALVAEHEIDLLLLGAECRRMPVFEAIGSCLHLRVRLAELSTFYEETFGHVPAAEINAAWFQCIADPSYCAPSAFAKRALDVAGALLVGLPFLVVLAVVAPLIRRDGGPLFFWQLRVGEGGRPLRLCKLRTMAVGSDAAWASADDPRVTRIGRVLRRTHVDELPQLLHVLRGEMSLVGPRPEQPHLVAQLERDVPFYSSRQLVRPGIAGWAQLRCGYAGSELGSAWKLCHDLYYLKHRSLAFDLAILAETARTLFVDPHRVPDPTASWFIVGRRGPARQVQPAAAAGHRG